MFAMFRDASTGRAPASARSKPRRRATAVRTFDALEDRSLMSLGVVSAVGIGGDDLFSGGALNFSSNKIGSTAIDSQGDVFVAGEFAGSVNFSPNGSLVRTTPNDEFEMYVAKYSPQGAPIWVDVIGPPAGNAGIPGFPPDFANGLAVDGSGNVYVTGSFSEELDFNPDPNSPSPHDLTPFNTDVFVLKLGADGSYQTSADFGDDSGAAFPGTGEGTSIAVDGSGANIVIVGDFTDTIDFNPLDSVTGQLTSQAPGVQDGFVVELNSSLSFNWEEPLSSPTFGSTSAITSAAFNSGDKVYVGGFFGSDSSGDQDAFIARLSPSGSTQQVQFIGDEQTSNPLNGAASGSAVDDVTGVAVDSAGNVYATGNFQGKAVNFNDNGNSVVLDSSQGGTQQDAFIAKYDSNFNLQWVDRLGSGASAQPVASVGVTVDSAGDVFFGGTFLAPASYNGPGTSNQPVLSPTSANAQSSDAYLVQVVGSSGNLDSSGGTPNVFAAGSSAGTTQIFDIAGNANGQVAFTGTYSGNSTPQFGSKTLPSQGDTNAFIAELTKGTTPTPTPTPTPPTPTPTPTPTPSSPTSPSSTTPTPTPTPPPVFVAEQSIVTGRGKHKKVVGFEFVFSGALDPGKAGSTGNYFVTQKRGKKLKALPVLTAGYNSATNTVTITVAGFKSGKPAQATITGLTGAKGALISPITTGL